MSSPPLVQPVKSSTSSGSGTTLTTSTNTHQIRIGNYTLLETIGVGSFGKVKKAVHAQTNLKVALKIVNRRKIVNLDMVTRMKREVSYMKLLRHPHIIKMYQVITTPTDILLVMEYAGGELFNYIVDKGRMLEEEGRLFFQQLVCAVDYCHAHSIVHRDLKPENLLLDEFNNLKIADFGLSNILSDGDFLKTSCGSPNYAAPEVISGKLYAGPEVDVWSCGVIFYVMVCGRLPFDDDYIPNLFAKINQGLYTLPSFLSPPVRQIIQSMLQVDPMKRITLAAIKKLPWFQVDLPPYLLKFMNTHEQPSFGVAVTENLDAKIIERIQKCMGFDRAVMDLALQDPENNAVKVAYELISDHEQLIGNGKYGAMGATVKSDHSYTLLGGGKKLPSSSPSKTANTRGFGISDGPTGLLAMEDEVSPTIHPLLPTPPPPSSKSMSMDKLAKRLRTKWHYGIRSKSPPLDIMLEIYRAIERIGMEWISLDPFHILCHFEQNPERKRKVKFHVNLYQIEAESYLVDFKKHEEDAIRTYRGHETQDQPTTFFLGGHDSVQRVSSKSDMASSISSAASSASLSTDACSSFAFFDACIRIITELAISG